MSNAPVNFLERALHARQRGLIVDVGAAAGEFSAALMSRHHGQHWLLVEPTPGAADRLRSRFAGRPDIIIAAVALGAVSGSGGLQCHGDQTQNSLLRRVAGTADLARVEIDTLDHLLSLHPGLPPPQLIKIDTQGTDLDVLLGARATIERWCPLIQVEAITVPLYDGQCSPAAIHSLLANMGYEVADISMAHHMENGRLAFCDLVFAPREPVADPDGPFYCRDPQQLLEQVYIQAKAAEERLALVNRLHGECQQRLTVIEDLERRLQQSGPSSDDLAQGQR